MFHEKKKWDWEHSREEPEFHDSRPGSQGQEYRFYDAAVNIIWIFVNPDNYDSHNEQYPFNPQL